MCSVKKEEKNQEKGLMEWRDRGKTQETEIKEKADYDKGEI